jgi:hypothetical protein
VCSLIIKGTYPSHAQRDDEAYVVDTMKRTPRRGWPDVFEINRAARSVLRCARIDTVTETEKP